MSDEARVTDLREAKFGIQKVRNSRYVFEYKNIWDPIKKRSKPLYRISVGKIIGNEIIINDDYLARHPQLAQGDFVLKDGKPAYEPKIEAPSSLFKVRAIDHFVLTSPRPQVLAQFYSDLGLRVEKTSRRYEVYLPFSKINIHDENDPLLPAAENPTPGCGDFCLEIETGSDLHKIAEAFRNQGVDVEGPLQRHGAKGAMQSIYLRDPDRNLVELSVYTGNENDTAG
ncbi:VOC family protein [uncultured Parasutterella sp.]|uniref:VOC family protein n=1 Tax=uncultured Parasutterella sp. TaxID=1263098 RepID=UPI002592ECA3|nr:VOC family protein [uncultured Parasutterella sp.]